MHDHLAIAVECHHDAGESQNVGAPLAQVMAQLFQLGLDGLDFCFQGARLRRVEAGIVVAVFGVVEVCIA